MNKKILYKLLLIFALLACTLLITNTKSFAADNFTHTSDVYNSSYLENSSSLYQGVYDLIDNNQDYFTFTSSELPEYQIIVKALDDTGAYRYDFFTSSVPVYIYSPNTDEDSIAFRYNFTSSPYEYKRYMFYIDSTGFYTYSNGASIRNATNSSSTYMDNYGLLSGYKIVNSNYDILNENNEVVFQQPPQVMEQETTLAPIVEEMEAKKTLAEVVGVLPVVLVVIVGLLAMRKAIRFLMRTLKQG